MLARPRAVSHRFVQTWQPLFSRPLGAVTCRFRWQVSLVADSYLSRPPVRLGLRPEKPVFLCPEALPLSQPESFACLASIASLKLSGSFEILDGFGFFADLGFFVRATPKSYDADEGVSGIAAASTRAFQNFS